VIHFDTSFVVDVLRESQHGGGPATSFMSSLPTDGVAISMFVSCELLAGAALAHRGEEERQRARNFFSQVRIVYPDGGDGSRSLRRRALHCISSCRSGDPALRPA
jgi:predicted nucleic acid-binding protein